MSHSTCPPRSKEVLSYGENNYYLSPPADPDKHEPKIALVLLAQLF